MEKVYLLHAITKNKTVRFYLTVQDIIINHTNFIEEMKTSFEKNDF